MYDNNESAIDDEFMDETEPTNALTSSDSAGWADSMRALSLLQAPMPTSQRSRIFDYGSMSHDMRDASGRASRASILSSTMSSIVDIPRPELGDVLEADSDTVDRTAEIAANSPRYRRRSSTFIDGVHDLASEQDGKNSMAPAQLYSTMSGRLFHSGRIAIVLVGPPARGKT